MGFVKVFNNYYSKAKVNMQLQDYGIESTYVVPQSYASVAEYSKRRNIVYDNYLEIFQKIFVVYREFYEETQQLFKAKTHEKSIYVQEFKSFLRKFAQIMKDTSVYQIDCLTELRVNRQELVSRVTSEILPKIEGYSKGQRNFSSKLKDLIDKRQQVSKQYFNLKNEAAEASVFYNSKYMKAKAKAISDQLTDIALLQKQLNTGKLQINSNAEQFQSYLLNFRKKLLQNKYSMLNRMADQSKHLRGCITEILLLLIECINSKLQFFMSLIKNPKDDTITISQSKGRKKELDVEAQIHNLVSSIQEYNHIIDEIVFILKGLDKAFKKIGTKIEDILENNKKYFLDNINNLYTIDETPSREVTQTLDLFQYFTSKIVGISDQIYQCTNKLNVLKQNVKRHADVTLSLIRANKGKEETKIPQLDQVYSTISYEFVTQIICEVYMSFKDTLTGLKSYFNEKYYKKKKMKVQDSMEVSHIDQTMIAQKKKPCKKQLWLWRDWRDKSNFSIQSSELNIKEIEQFVNGIKYEEDSKEVKAFDTTFQGKKDIKGIIKICEKAIEFVSPMGTSNTHLCIPYADITQAEIKVRRTFEKYISIETDKGELGFKCADNQAVQSLIKQWIQKSHKTGGAKVVKRQAVQLLPEQIDFIQKNRTKINEQRPNPGGMIKVKSIFVENVTVDQVYEYIYSDKQFTIRGKPEETFFAFSNKKAKNFNYKTTPYDKPGPQFYTRDPSVKFTNCPLFSTRVCQFDHPMPPLPIPFMPKSCHCKQTCSIYWLSNEAFDYLVVSQSSQAPYSDTFIVKMIHRVFKEGTGVKIELQGGLFFVKDPPFKSILKSKGEAEMVEMSEFTFGQIDKTLNIVAGNAKEPEKQAAEDTPADKNQQTKPNNEVNKLKYQNKLLLIALVVVFLLNVVLRFLMP